MLRRRKFIQPWKKSRYALIAASIGIAAAPIAAGQTKLVIASDTIVSERMTVPAGATCIIKPGVRVLFEGYQSLTVKGLIIAEGTSTNPIVFSAAERPSGSRERPSWKGIEIIGKEANGQFKHCRFEGAYRLLVWESKPSFDSCEFTGNHYALCCAKRAAPHVNGCLIHHNAYGVAADFSFPLLLGTTITENTVGLHLQLSSEAIAGKNTITGNETNIHIENALGGGGGSFSLQGLWELLLQLY